MEIAHQIEKRIGKARHLKLTGNRPIPGGISSTTWAWFAKHQPGVLRKADLVGHLTTFLHRTLTGARVTDPSNASFMGVYSTLTLKGWNEELCEAVGADPRLLAGDFGWRSHRRKASPPPAPETVWSDRRHPRHHRHYGYQQRAAAARAPGPANC